MSEYQVRFLMMALFVIFAPFIGGFFDGVDRKLSARMQGRKGPKLFQPFIDVAKLMHKQFLSVNKFQMLMIASYMFFIMLSGALFFGGFDMLMCFFSLSTAAMFLILASTATHSPYAEVGSQREMLQMMAYEPMVLLTAVGFYLATGSFSVKNIIASDIPAICFAPGFFIGFIFILTIKFRKSPFDLSTSHHAHQEVVKGVTTEMVGIEYACTTIAEWYENVFLLGVIGLFFITSNPLSIIGAVVAIIVVFFIEILIDNTSARVKWQLMLKLAWGVTLVTGGLNLLILELVRH